MATTSDSDDLPILYLWPLSAWAAKITAYLALRGIPYTQCHQPITQPRSDLAALGVAYRRIPLLSVGRDIYCDTLLILEELERRYPSGGNAQHRSISSAGLSGQKGWGTAYALEKLFEKWTDAVVFQAAAAVIPSGLDLMKDPGFQKDREELWGRSWGAEEQDRLRPQGLSDLRGNFDLLENILEDGREWIAGGEGPVLADIHAAWIFDWLLLLDSYDMKFFSDQTYPRTFAYLTRYKSAIAAAKKSAPQPAEISGAEAVSRVLNGSFKDGLKVEDDPEGLREGDEVEMWPKDTGFTRQEKGKLVGLGKSEMVVQKKSEAEGYGGKEVRVHYPRWNFVIKKVGSESGDGEGEEEPEVEGGVLRVN